MNSETSEYTSCTEWSQITVTTECRIQSNYLLKACTNLVPSDQILEGQFYVAAMIWCVRNTDVLYSSINKSSGKLGHVIFIHVREWLHVSLPWLTVYSSLLGVEVVGEEDVVVTNEAMSFQWKDYVFKLNIWSISESPSWASFNFLKAEFVSAVCCLATPRTFAKPVTLETQHCTNFSYPSQLCLIRTCCIQKVLPYKFKIVDSLCW